MPTAPNYDPDFTVDLNNPVISRRVTLQEKLEAILGSKNVYFQPPKNTMLQYPAIIYNRSPMYRLRADDQTYLLVGHYSVTFISPDVEECMEMMTKLLDGFQHISVERSFVSDNLNHDVYNLYF